MPSDPQHQPGRFWVRQWTWSPMEGKLGLGLASLIITIAKCIHGLSLPSRLGWKGGPACFYQGSLHDSVACTWLTPTLTCVMGPPSLFSGRTSPSCVRRGSGRLPTPDASAI